MAWSNDFQIENSGDELTVTTYLASKNLIDPNSVKFHYSFDNGETFNVSDMKITEPNGDKNNSGKYSAKLKLTSQMDNFKSFFSAEDYNGNKSVYPGDAVSKAEFGNN